MRTKLLAIALLITTTLFSQNSDKKLLFVQEGGIPEVYYYEETFKTQGSKIYVWISTEYHVQLQDSLSADIVDPELGIMYNAIKEYCIYDISKNKYTSLLKKYISDNGVIVKTIKQEEAIAEWEYIEPETEQQYILKRLIQIKNDLQ